MNDRHLGDKKASKKNFLISVLILGSLCGLLEVVLGGLLRQFNFPYRAGLLTGLGFGVIAVGLAIFKKPTMAIWIGLVAVLCRQLIIPILHVSIMCKANSCLAIMLEYSALAGIAAIFLWGKKGNAGRRILTGGGAAFVASIAFYLIGMQVAPCRYLLSFQGAGGLAAFLWKEGLSWMIFSAVLFPLGWQVGEKITEKTFILLARRPRLYYSAATVITVFCWVACALAISGGI